MMMVEVVRMMVLRGFEDDRSDGDGSRVRVDEDVAGWVVEWSGWSGWREGERDKEQGRRRRRMVLVLVALAGTKHSLLSPTWHSDRWSAFLIYNEHHHQDLFPYYFFPRSQRILKSAKFRQQTHLYTHIYTYLKTHTVYTYEQGCLILKRIHMHSNYDIKYESKRRLTIT